MEIVGRWGVPTTDESSFTMLQAEFLEFLSKDTCWFATQLQDIFAILALAKTKGQNLIYTYLYIYLIVVCGFKLQLWCPLPHIEQAPEMVHDFFREMGRNHFPARLMTVNCAVFSSQVPKITGITLVVEPPAGHTGVRKTVPFSLQKYQQNWCQIGSTPLPGLLFLWVVSTCFKYV